MMLKAVEFPHHDDIALAREREELLSRRESRAGAGELLAEELLAATVGGRSLRDLIDVVNSLQDRGVGLRSLQEAIDTTTPAGKLTFHIFAALAEFERDMIRERTSAGLAAARKRGVAIGRPRALTPEQILMAEAMTADPAISTRQVAEQFGIHRSTLYRHLNARQKRSA